MPIDAVFLESLRCELQEQLLACRVDKVQQPERDTILLSMRGASGGGKLLLTASPSFYLEPLKTMLGVEAVIGTRMNVDDRERYTGDICGDNCGGNFMLQQINAQVPVVTADIGNARAFRYIGGNFLLPRR